jgi:hypothetical protein
MTPESLAGGGPSIPHGAAAVATDDLPPRLEAIGNDLSRATCADLRRARKRRRIRRRAIGCAAAVAVLVPGAALAHSLLTTPQTVAASMPAGTKFLVGSTPVCTVVKQDVEYRCTVDHAVNTEVSDLTGTVEPTVDSTKHVNGGCRSLNHDGTLWSCYIGKAAVAQKIIGPDFLGQYAPSPGEG